MRPKGLEPPPIFVPRGSCSMSSPNNRSQLCVYDTLNSSKTEFMLIGLPQQLRKNLWKITCCYNYFCSQLWLNIDEHLTFYDQSCLYCLKCTKFCQLILRKIIKIVVTRCHILRLKCTKFNFGWGFVPDPAGGAYSAPPDP